jgi:hypothetical protein
MLERGGCEIHRTREDDEARNRAVSGLKRHDGWYGDAANWSIVVFL